MLSPSPASRWSLGLILASVLFWGVLGTALPAVAADAGLLKAMEEEIASLMERNRPFVVSIQGTTRRRGETGPGASGPPLAVRRTVGSGIILDGSGHILTTGEVVADAEFIQVSLASGQVVGAELLAVDDDSKVAVLSLDGKVTSSPRFGDSDRVRMGHYALIIGNACGVMAPSLGSVVDFRGDGDLIQISGSAWPGNSGAPVFNSAGQVVGIVRGILAPNQQEELTDAGRVRESSSPATLLAIPINQARRIARDLMSGGWLGVGVEFTRQDGIPKVFQIVNEGPACVAGIRVGDMLLSYNGEKIRDGDHLEKLVKRTSPGNVADMEVERDRQRLTLQVKIGLRGSPVSRRSQSAPSLAMDPALPASDGRDVMQRLQALERQMQMLLQRRDGKADK